MHSIGARKMNATRRLWIPSTRGETCRREILTDPNSNLPRATNLVESPRFSHSVPRDLTGQGIFALRVWRRSSFHDPFYGSPSHGTKLIIIACSDSHGVNCF